MKVNSHSDVRPVGCLPATDGCPSAITCLDKFGRVDEQIAQTALTMDIGGVSPRLVMWIDTSASLLTANALVDNASDRFFPPLYIVNCSFLI